MRAGINILSIIIPIGIVLAVTIIAFAVYKAAYKRRINKRLAEGREADIKPMMSPVKFVVITLLCSIVGLILLWGLLILIFTAHLKIDRLNLASVPSIRMMPNELLEDSVIGEYKFGDEIKGYTKHTFNDKDTCLEVYILNEEYTHVFAPVLVAAKYTEQLKEVVKTPVVPKGYYSSWAQYTIQAENRDELQARLKAAGIPSMVYYPRTMSQQTAFAYLNQKPCPVAEQLTKTVLSLPMHPYMTDEEIEIVANTVLNND